MDHSNLHFLITILLSGSIAFAGYFLISLKKPIISWSVFLLSTLLIERMTVDDHPVWRMFNLVIIMFAGMKLITTTYLYQEKKFNLTLWQWLIFFYGWAGMKATIFEEFGKDSIPGWKTMLFSGVKNIFLGTMFFLIARYLYLSFTWTSGIQVLTTILLLICYSLILHFGLLAISAGFLKYNGVNTYYLFNSPLKSNSISSFWNRRWNLAFSEMTSIAVFRPMRKSFHSNVALLFAFVFSGLLHEAAISLPVHKGFGLPLLYFLIQAAILMFENFLEKRKILFYKTGISGKIWMWFWIIAPAPILFHQYFIREIIWAIAGIE